MDLLRIPALIIELYDFMPFLYELSPLRRDQYNLV